MLILFIEFSFLCGKHKILFILSQFEFDALRYDFIFNINRMLSESVKIFYPSSGCSFGLVHFAHPEKFQNLFFAASNSCWNNNNFLRKTGIPKIGFFQYEIETFQKNTSSCGKS